MALIRDRYCSFCGRPFSEPLRYPRQCEHPGCGAQAWANPIPVSVVLVPVETEDGVGLLVVRRAIEPRRGLLALVGGFLEAHETWQEGGAREVREEAGVLLDPSTLAPYWFTSTAPRPDRVLLFSVAPAQPLASLRPFTPGHECSARGLVFGPEGLDEMLAFPLHVLAARRWFEAHGIAGASGFREV